MTAKSMLAAASGNNGVSAMEILTDKRFVGAPCKRCGNTMRLKSTTSCIACSRERTKKGIKTPGTKAYRRRVDRTHRRLAASRKLPGTPENLKHKASLKRRQKIRLKARAESRRIANYIEPKRTELQTDTRVVGRPCRRCGNTIRHLCNNACVTCLRARTLARRSFMRTPVWANKKAIAAIYAEKHRRGPGWVVDHVIPLNGELVSGLHVEYNLQLLTVEANTVKGNQWIA